MELGGSTLRTEEAFLKVFSKDSELPEFILQKQKTSNHAFLTNKMGGERLVQLHIRHHGMEA